MTLPGGMSCVVLLADEQLARSEVDPPEMMASTLIHPDRTIEQPRLLRSAIYELSIKAEQSIRSLDPPRCGFQKGGLGR